MRIRQGRLWGFPFSGEAWLRKCMYFYLLHHSRAWLITTSRGTSGAATDFSHRQHHAQHFNQGCYHHGCSGIASRLSRDDRLLFRKGEAVGRLCVKLDSERWVAAMRLRYCADSHWKVDCLFACLDCISVLAVWRGGVLPVR